METPVRVVHYLNQFFGGIGAEEHANTPVQVRDGPVGPGRALQQMLGESGSVVATIICGDNYFVEETEAASQTVREALERIQPSVVVSGPAFDAGRYGMACGLISGLATELGIPSVTAMHPDNSGIVVYGKDMIAIPTGVDAAEMQAVLKDVAGLAIRLGRGNELGPADEEGYLPRGYRRIVNRDKSGAERALEMLTAYVHDRPFTTEIPIRAYEAIPAPAPIANIREATIAMVSSGGIVPRSNPDHQVSSRAENYFKYPIEGIDELSVDDWISVHGGFNTVYLNTKDPNYALPLRYARRMEAQGEFKSLYHTCFTTAGTGCAVSVAQRMGAGIAGELRDAGVDAVLMVAT